jgi:hypothetical protein
LFNETKTIAIVGKTRQQNKLSVCMWASKQQQPLFYLMDVIYTRLGLFGGLRQE